ncbi:MAG: hypothetical protein H7039_03070, partial [Bryobacteraceae bacterium]|nr:hypothetical protein [Bryobacteraceae bacterium]
MMFPPSRRWPILGGIALLLLLTGGAIYYFAGTLKPATTADLVGYFPAREATVLYFDVNALRASGILEKLVGSTVGEASEYRAFIAQTGFDYKRDLDRVLLNSSGGIHYFLLEGRFDWNKLKAYAKEQKGSCSGNDCHLQGSTPDRVISWRKLSGGRMALASARDENGARDIAPDIETRRPEPVAYEIPNTPIWLHVPGEVLRATQQLPPGTRLFAKALETAERATFALGSQDKKFALAAEVVCKNPEDAAVLRAQLEGIT